MKLFNSIKKLEEEIEEEQKKRPIRCFAEAMKYGGSQDNDKCKMLKAKLQTLKDVLKLINKIKLPEDKDYRYSNEYIENWVEELKQEIEGK